MLDYRKKIKPEVRRILFNHLKPEYRGIKIRGGPYNSETKSVFLRPQPAEALIIREMIIKIATIVAYNRSVNEKNLAQKCQSEIEKYQKENSSIIKELFL